MLPLMPFKDVHFCTPEFPEIGKRYASSAYFFPFLNSPSQEIIKSRVVVLLGRKEKVHQKSQ